MAHSVRAVIGEPILFQESPLHGMYFAPVDVPRFAVLMAPPLFEERRCAHRALIACARALAQAGAAVLLPDISGTGNSQGDLTTISLDRWKDDLRAAAEELCARISADHCVVLGCRAGAVLATHVFAEDPRVQRHILWHPVTAIRTYLHQLRTRRMIQTQVSGQATLEVDPHEIEGHRISPQLLDALQALRLPEHPPSAPTSILQCSFNEKILTEYARLAAQWGEQRVRMRTFVCQPFWLPHSPSDYQALAEAVVQEVCHA